MRPFTRIMLVVFIGLFAMFLRQEPAGYAAVPNANMPLGVCVHVWAGLSKADIDRTLDAAAAGHFKIVRWEVPWKVVEQEKGVLVFPPLWDYIADAVRARGLESLVILDYGNKFYDNGDKPRSPEAVNAYASYASFMAQHLGKRVRYYEIWNEWNITIGGGTAGNANDYVALVKATYPRIKRVAPHSTVMVGSFINYHQKGDAFDGLLHSDIGDYSDAIALHPYVAYRKDNSVENFSELLDFTVKNVRRAKGLEHKPIYITEVGWSTASKSPHGVSEQLQKENMVRAVELSKSYGLDGLVMYSLRDGNGPASDTESGFGALRNDWTPKPVYGALAAISK